LFNSTDLDSTDLETGMSAAQMPAYEIHNNKNGKPESDGSRRGSKDSGGTCCSGLGMGRIRGFVIYKNIFDKSHFFYLEPRSEWEQWRIGQIGRFVGAS
jgi:hypothetical protein